MIDPHVEAKRIIDLINRLEATDANKKMQIQVIENALKRAYVDGSIDMSNKMLEKFGKES